MIPILTKKIFYSIIMVPERNLVRSIVRCRFLTKLSVLCVRRPNWEKATYCCLFSYGKIILKSTKRDNSLSIFLLSKSESNDIFLIVPANKSAA